MNTILSLIPIGLAFAIALVVVERGLRRVYDYGVTPTHFQVRLFGRIPFFAIARRDITDVYPWRFRRLPLFATFTTLRFGNRIFGRAIVIERKTQFPKYLIVTPNDPAATIAALRPDPAIPARPRP